MSKSSYKVLSTKYHNSKRSEKTSKTCSSDQSKSNLFGDQTHLRIPYRFPLDTTIPNHWLDKVAKCDWRQENFICVKTPLGDRDDFQVIQLYLNQDYSLSVEALVQQFPKATGLYYYNTDNSLCGVPQNQEKLFPPSSGKQTFYFTELGCNCSAWVQDIKAQISQISHFKSQVERLEEEIEVSRANYNNSVSQLKKEIEDMRLEMKQLKESNMEDVCMLKQEFKKNKLKGNTEPNFDDAVSRGGDSDFFDGPWDVGDGEDSDQDEGSVAGLVRPTSGNVASSQTSSEEGPHCLGCGGARDYGSLPDYQQMTQDSGGIDERVNRGTAAKLPKSKRRSPAAKAKGVSRLLEFQARLSCEKGLPPSRLQLAQESEATHISASPPILPGSSMSTYHKNLLADLDGLETSCPSFGGQNVVISKEENEMPVDRIQGAQGGSQGKTPVPKARECKWCYTPDHEKGNCPAWGYTCYQCGQLNHWQFTKICRGGFPLTPDHNKGGGGGRRGRGNGNNSRGSGNYRGNNRNWGRLKPRKPMRGKDGKLMPKKINYVEDLEDGDDQDQAPVYEYDSGRVITVSRFIGKDDRTARRKL